jgi:peptidoglycan/xylan/chitin deacetylase (PgdA/CDA1 family)
MHNLLKQSYYYVKPFIPLRLKLALRRKYLRYQLGRCSDVWPINQAAGIPPPEWQGWPEGKQFALVLTHDVEGDTGLKKCYPLLELEMQLGFRSSFNFVAEDYEKDSSLFRFLTNNGFEIGLHGLAHRGNLFRSKDTFSRQLPKLKKYLKAWKAVGFRAPSMYHNLEWMHELELEYDSSTFDTDPFEPQPDGVGTIFPFWVHNKHSDTGYVELPYTLPQDFTVFILMQEKDTQLWRKKLDWVVQCRGMALIISHPDYMNFDGNKLALNEYASSYYREFLMYIKENYNNQYWHVLPGQMARFWSNNYSTKSERVTASEAQQSLHLQRAPSRVVVLDPLKDPRWDKFVEKHPYGWIVHLSGWKKVIENSFPHMKGHYLAVINGTDGEIRAALPVFDVNSWLLGRRLISIPFATLSDPLVTTQEDMQILFKEALDLSKKLRTSYLEIRSLQSFPLIQDTRFCCSDFYKHHYLTLTKELDELKKSFHRTNVRQRIQRAQNSNISLKVADSESDLIEFFNLHKKMRKRQCLPPQPYILFKQLWDAFAPLKYMTLLLAQKDDQTISGLILFKFKDRVSAEFLASDDSYLNLSPNHLLFWEAIKTAREEGFKIFDFGRTSPLNSSLMKFKSHWGTTIVDLPHFVYPDRARGIIAERETSLGYRLSKTICKNAPEPFYSLAGRFYYRHLG